MGKLFPGISHQFVHVGDSRIIVGVTTDDTIALITFIPYTAVLLSVVYFRMDQQVIYLCVIHLIDFVIVRFTPSVVMYIYIAAITLSVVF